MIGKLPVLGFALVTAVGGPALAREPCESRQQPAGYGYGYGSYGPGTAGTAPTYRPSGYSARIEAGLRYSDLDRNGWVTLDEALAHGRHEFRRSDGNRDRVLSRHEVDWGGSRHRGRHGQRDGRVTLFEYQDAVRAHFAGLDANRDGILARHELGHQAPGPSRSAGWWSYR
jgi:hypothetical protein